MGGWGSGRPQGKPTTDNAVRWAWSQNIGNRLNRLKPGTLSRPQALGPFTSDWTGWGAKDVIDTCKWAIHLEPMGNHFIRFNHSAGQQDIQLVWWPRPLGGGRWLMQCPYTRRRCWVLYRPIGSDCHGFASFGAWNMRYASDNSDRYSRATAQILKLRRRLGGEHPNLLMPTCYVPKPKRMHWKTYRRIVQKAKLYEAIRDERFAAIEERLERLEPGQAERTR